MQVTEVKDSFSLESVVPFFQPIMDLDKNAVWSYECLARLLTPSDTSYLPTEFLFLVERQQSFAQLTQTIFSRSASYFRDINMAWNINLSVLDMTNPAILDFLQSQLSEYPNPNRISIEITAQAAIGETASFEAFSEQCKQLGVNIVIDNFEQTECDLNALMSLPISAIKVPAKTLESVKEDSAADFFEQLTRLAKVNKIAIVAERVEHQDTLDVIKQLGIRYAQGFYFSQPKANAD